MNKEELFHQMVKNQRDDIPEKYKLYYKDIKRVLKYINISIFENKCTEWSGYITNNKTNYVNFYLHDRKIALHRILYINFIDNLYDSEYLKIKCKNNGCNCLSCIVKKKSDTNLIKKDKINKLFTVSFF
jgi:hypothetical protein